MLLEIGFGEAWIHAMSLGSYWLWVVIAGALLFLAVKWVIADTDQSGWDNKHFLVLFVAAALFLAALLIPPATTAANTTPEQAARGVYIN